ncbi:uncharacterized protein [Argopecten irradians]|uniref:uncharacterized protein n=1 Tax=Argopecten irradians TaxID=31199 RepID=UPI00371BD603
MTDIDMRINMKVPLFISLASSIWLCVVAATTTTDGLVQDEYCSTGYTRYNSATMRTEEVKYYIYCSSKQYCCGMFENRHCCIYQYYQPYDYPSTNAIIFGSIAAAIMFLCFIVCVIAKWRKPSQPVTDPRTIQALQSITGGNIPRSPFPGLIISPANGNTIQTPSTNTEMSPVQTDTSAPPPDYEECIQNNLIVPPDQDKGTDNTSIRLEQATTVDQGCNVNASDSITSL